MDHAAMGHTTATTMEMVEPNSTADNSAGMGMMHGMTFTTKWTNLVLLFPGAELTAGWHLAFSFILVVILAVLYEVLRVYRQVRFHDAQKRMAHLKYESVRMEQQKKLNPNGCSGSENGSTKCSQNGDGGVESCVVTVPKDHYVCSFEHNIQTALHFVQVTFSFLLMLVFMTFQLYLCLAVVLGLTLGYWLTAHQLVKLYEPTESGECC